MSATFDWCLDRNRLKTLNKQVFCVDEYGDKCWYLNGKSHRINGPAIECANGNKWWCLNDTVHRENGPAIECADGAKHWYLNGKRHRVDGPAIEYVGGYNSWYLHDTMHSESDYWKKMNK